MLGIQHDWFVLALHIIDLTHRVVFYIVKFVNELVYFLVVLTVSPLGLLGPRYRHTLDVMDVIYIFLRV